MNLRFHDAARAGSALVAALAIGLSGCGKDNPTQPPGSSRFRGAFTGAATTGCLSITVDTATPAPQGGNRAVKTAVTATGSIRFYGSRVDVTGTYDETADTVTLSGGGWTVSGNLAAYGMEGTMSGPQTAVFSLYQYGADTVRVFTGTFDSSTAEDGNFNFAIRGTGVRGHAVDSTGTVVVLSGTFAPSDSSITITHPGNPAGPPFATGRLHPDESVSGTYDDQSGDSGTWAGNKFN
jgi:hypothetical protein